MAFLHRIAFGVVVVGISLSCLHHSSLGSLFLVTPQRLHPLWYTPLLPLLFILSAMGAGIMFLVLVRIIHARWYDPDAVFGPRAAEREVIRSTRGAGAARVPAAGRDMPMLTGLASVGTGILGVWLILQLVHLGSAGTWEAFAAGTWESWLFAGELTISAAVPLLLVWLPATRGSPAALTVAAFAASAGLALNRLDVGIFGYFRDAGRAYFPALAEWALSLGVVAAAALVFLFFTEHLDVFESGAEEPDARPFGATFDSLSRVWRSALQSGVERATIIGVLVIPVAWAVMYPPFDQRHADPVEPAAGLDVTRAHLAIDGNRGGVRTEFPHQDHQQRLGGAESCATCHHLSLPEDETTPCSRCHRHMLEPTLIFEHEQHRRWVAEEEELGGVFPENHTCTSCHPSTGAKTAANAVSCLECHADDTGWEAYRRDDDLAWSVSYMEAMHGTCLDCHEEEADQRDQAQLRDCSTCHRSLEPRGSPIRTYAARQ